MMIEIMEMIKLLKRIETGSIDLSWMNNLQLYRQIAPEVFPRYDRDKDSFELFTLRTFIDNINNERVKNKKDARELNLKL